MVSPGPAFFRSRPAILRTLCHRRLDGLGFAVSLFRLAPCSLSAIPKLQLIWLRLHPI